MVPELSPIPGHHPLQHHCQRRQNDLSDPGSGAAAGASTWCRTFQGPNAQWTRYARTQPLREVRKLLESVGTEGCGCWIFPRHDPLHRSGQDRYGPCADDKIELPRRLLHGRHGGLLPGSQPPATRCSRTTHETAGRQMPITAARSRVRWSKKVVTYLYNREHDWDLSPENSGKNTTSPAKSKAATSPESAASPTNSRPAPRSKTAEGWGNGYGSTPSRTSRFSTLAQDDQTMPNVVGGGTQRRPGSCSKAGASEFPSRGRGSDSDTKASLPARGSRAGEPQP